MNDDTKHNESQGLAGQITDYVNLRIDAAKLTVVERAAKLGSTISGALIFALLMTIAVLMFAVAVVLLISYFVGSLILALLIVGVSLMIIAAVIYSMRHKLFSDSMVRVFVSLMFELHDEVDKQQK